MHWASQAQMTPTHHPTTPAPLTQMGSSRFGQQRVLRQTANVQRQLLQKPLGLMARPGEALRHGAAW